MTRYIQVIFLPESSQWVIGLLFYLSVLFGIKTGIENVTMISEVFLLIILVFGTAIGIITQPDKNYQLLSLI